MSTVLEVKNVSKYLEREVWTKNQKSIQSFSLKNFDFAIEPGYIVGMIGCNGSGKTSLIHTILGVFQPDEGEILVDGHSRKTDAYEVKQEIAFVTDDMIFPIGMTAVDIGKCFGSCYRAFDYKKYITLCERFQIPLKKNMKKLSTGMKIKVQLAFAMAREAKLYVFDEPSAGLDPVFRRELMDYFFEIVADGTKSILLSTHLTEELDRIADYILYVEDGKQLFYMEKEEMLGQYRLIRGSKNQVQYYGRRMVAMQENEMSCEALLLNTGEELRVPVMVEVPTIEKVMYYLMQQKKGEKKHV
ncbi:MAG: ABC transporter ATP-binding protein [Lachnospiraceae bacterium]|nr:ABC transporter ATP-binding protein [Lachnospiraceae bacterium]